MLCGLRNLAGAKVAIAMDWKNAKTTTTDATANINVPLTGSTLRPQPRRNWLWLILHITLYPFFRTWVRTRGLHTDRLDRQQGGILLINHQSYLDPILVAVRISRPVAYLARESLFQIPGLGFILRNCFVVAISRTAFRGSTVRVALNRLERGFLIALFPEGTRRSGIPTSFRPGFLTIARRTDVPIYPVAIVGADAVMPRGTWFPRPRKVTVVYGHALSANELQRLNDVDDKTAAGIIEAKVCELYLEGMNT